MSKKDIKEKFWDKWDLIGRDLPIPLCEPHEYHFARVCVGEGPGIRKRFKASGLRDWKFDLCWINHGLKVAVELEGGTWNGGAHVRGEHYSSDCAKYNLAQELGFIVLRYTVDMIDNDPVGVFDQIRRVLEMRTV